MDLAPTDPIGRSNHAAGRDHGTPADADTCWRDLFTSARGHGACRMQIATQMHVGHDYGTTPEGDVCGASDSAAA
jgi:hypothetical protein